MPLTKCFYVLCFWSILGAGCVTNAAESKVWTTSIPEAMEQAARENKLVLLHFWDHGCPPCRRLEAKVFPQEDFIKAIQEHYVAVKINVSDSPRSRKQYRVRRWPTDIVLNTRQQQLHRGVSKPTSAEFVKLLEQLARGPSQPDLTITDTPAFPIQTISGTQEDRLSVFPIGTETTSAHPPGTPQPESRLGMPRVQAPPPGPAGHRTHRSVARPAVPPGTLPPARRTPPAHPPLGLDGYCPVTLAGFQNGFPQWRRGNPQWGAIHQGQLYLFAGLHEQQEFLRFPDRYSPVLAGRDVVRLAKHNESAAGHRQHGVTYRGRVFLFSNEYSLQEFRKAPNFYLRAASQPTPSRR